MAAQTSTAEKPTQRGDLAPAAKPQILVVDLGKAQSRKRIRQLRKGEGKLMGKVDAILGDLVEAGTLDRSAQPVVIVVREENPLRWPFG
jgi:hypothetical protein